jgi:hypothetical protein
VEEHTRPTEFPCEKTIALCFGGGGGGAYKNYRVSLRKKYSRVDKETADTDISKVSCINKIGSNKNVRAKEKGRE